MKTMNAEKLKEFQNRGVRITLINTLDEDHFEETQIPDSINIPQSKDDFEKRVEQTIGGKNQPVVLYCASAECPSSTEGAKKLDNAGFTEVYDFEGGAQEWLQHGGHLENVS